MTVETYLRALGIDTMRSYIELTFVRGRVFGEGVADRDFWYRTTPIRTIAEWFKSGTLDKYIVLNTEAYAMDWMSGANWNHAIKNKRYMCLLVVTMDELVNRYSESQAQSLVKYIDEKINEGIATNPWLQTPSQIQETPNPLVVYSRESEKILGEVRRALSEGKSVEWVCDYETFYGVGWDNWVRKNLNDVDCTIKVASINSEYGYADKLLITPNK